MKICWVTPFVLRSSIGRVSAEVAKQLAARGHQVEILRCEDQNDPAEPLHPTALPVHHWRSYDLNRLRAEFDVVVVNIGDNYPFHAGVFAILDAAPCLGIFHDFYIYNLFSGWLYYNGLDYQRHDAEIVALPVADGGIIGIPVAGFPVSPSAAIAGRIVGIVVGDGGGRAAGDQVQGAAGDGRAGRDASKEEPAIDGFLVVRHVADPRLTEDFRRLAGRG